MAGITRELSVAITFFSSEKIIIFVIIIFNENIKKEKMNNLILRSIKNRGEKIFAWIRDQIKNGRLRSLYIFAGIIIVVIVSYLVWFNFFYLEGMGVGGKQENPNQISQALNTGESFLARITTGIRGAFADMFGLPNENIIAEFPIEGRSVRERRSAENNPFVFVNKNSSYLGGNIIKSGSGFTLGREVIIFFSSPSGENKSITVFANQSGQFNYTYAVQPLAETGVYHYWAEDKTTGFVTDKVKYLIVSASQKNITSAQVAEILADANEESDRESPSLALPKECSFSGAGRATDAKRVVLNEVAWMGSTEHHTNEWIELKNISSSEVDISGWWLIDKGEQIEVVLPQNTIIPAGRFFLLERTDDNSAPGVLADMIYTGILSNDEEGLRLLSPDCLIKDEVLADPKWPAGEARGRKTMERKADLSGWQTSVFVDGTPKQRNSSGEITLPERSVATENTVATTNVSEASRNSPTIESVGTRGNQANITGPPPPAPAPALPLQCFFSATGTATGPKQVILNEIAWMGSWCPDNQECSNNEWIELKNISSSDVDISGWRLIDQKNQIRVLFLQNTTILAGGFFLLERTDDDTVPNMRMDMIYTGALSNNGEGLRLLSPDCLIQDEVLANPNWPAGEVSSRKTMERKTDLSGWQTSAVVNGTPRQRNSSGEVVLSEDNSMAVLTAPPPESLPSRIGEPIIATVRIIEVIFNPEGSDDGRERVILKNFGNLAIDLSNYSLQYLGQNNIFSEIKKRNFVAGNSIHVDGIFKIGMNCSTAYPCSEVNLSWSQDLRNQRGTLFLVSHKNRISSFDDAGIINIFKYPVVTYLPRVNNFTA